MDYIIKKDHILIADVAMYGDIVYDHLKIIKQGTMKIVFVDHVLLDLRTGDEIKQFRTEGDMIVDPIYENTYYIQETYKCPHVRDADLIRAAEVYELYLAKKELIKERKLIPFPQKRIY